MHVQLVLQQAGVAAAQKRRSPSPGSYADMQEGDQRDEEEVGRRLSKLLSERAERGSANGGLWGGKINPPAVQAPGFLFTPLDGGSGIRRLRSGWPHLRPNEATPRILCSRGGRCQTPR
jgi:hypothetical protein